MQIQEDTEADWSAKLRLSASFTTSSPNSVLTARVLGLHRAQASKEPEIMALTMPEASISIAVMSSIVRPAEARVFFRMDSLEVPEA